MTVTKSPYKGSAWSDPPNTSSLRKALNNVAANIDLERQVATLRIGIQERDNKIANLQAEVARYKAAVRDQMNAASRILG